MSNAPKSYTIQTPDIGIPFEKLKEFTDKPPIEVPRKTFLLGTLGVVTLILITWPFLIISYLLGAATVAKFGHVFDEPKKK